MSKIVLRNVQLINWYGFTNTIVPVAENLTLISGENECGKSTILDAIKYAYTGDTQFNKATSGYNTGVGKRNLISYTRCLVDASVCMQDRRRRSRLCTLTLHWNIMTRSMKNPLC